MPATIYDRSQSLDAFLDAAAAKQPAPGGGSIAALVGALSASMGEMVLNYTTGRKDLGAQEAHCANALAEFHRARLLMLELMAEDQAAYDALSTARKANDKEKFAVALLACIRIPQSVAATAIAILGLCDRVADFINPHLASDLAVCAELSMATVRCAIYNVRVNLADVPDEGECRKLDQGNARTTSQAAALIQRVLPKIWARRG